MLKKLFLFLAFFSLILRASFVSNGGGGSGDVSTGELSSNTTGLSVTNGVGAVVGVGTQLTVATATSSTNGFLSSDDWTTFNGKLSGTTGNLTTGTSGVSFTGGSNAVLGSGASLAILTASGSQQGLLSSTDWTTFSNKVGLTGSENISGVKTFNSIPKASGTPTNSDDLVNKAYADALAAGFKPKAPVQAATTTTLATNTYANGSSGVGATLTANSNGAFGSLDGYAVLLNDRVLVKNEATQTKNGIYTLTTVGSAGAPWVLTRATDFDSDAEIDQGSFVLVLNGTAGSNYATQWAMNAAESHTLGSTNLTWIQISQPQSYSAGNGLDITGTTFDLDLRANDGLAIKSTELGVDYDDTTIGITSNKLAIKNTAVSAGSYGSVTASPTFTVDAQGRLSAASSTSKRELLTANRTYYVRTDGSNSNTCLGDTAGTACLTIQGALDIVTSNAIDFGGNTVTIQVGDGTYTSGFALSRPWTGGGSLVIQGNSSNRDSVFINTAGVAMLVSTTLPGTLTTRYFKIQGSFGMYHRGNGIWNYGTVNFGAATSYHVAADTPGAFMNCVSDYNITGGTGASHLLAYKLAHVSVDNRTITVTGSPAFPAGFAVAGFNGVVFSWNSTWSGAATGPRYSATTNGVISVNGASTSYFPGNSAGSTSSGGQYL